MPDLLEPGSATYAPHNRADSIQPSSISISAELPIAVPNAIITPNPTPSVVPALHSAVSLTKFANGLGSDSSGNDGRTFDLAFFSNSSHVVSLFSFIDSRGCNIGASPFSLPIILHSLPCPELNQTIDEYIL